MILFVTASTVVAMVSVATKSTVTVAIAVVAMILGAAVMMFPSVFHADMLVVLRSVVVAMLVVIAVSAVVSPAVSTAIGDMDGGKTEIEEISSWVTGVDGEMPIACIPI